MKKLFVSLLTIVSVLLAFNTPSAHADPPPGWFYLAQYDTISLTHDTCTVTFVYGQFGGNAFSQAVVQNSGCGGGTGVQTFGWGAQTQLCQFITSPSVPGCSHITNGVQATVTATLIGGRIHIDPQPAVGNDIDLYFCTCP